MRSSAFNIALCLGLFVTGQIVCAQNQVYFETFDGSIYLEENKELVKTNPNGWGNEGAVSQNMLGSNESGYVEYQVESTLEQRMFGLSTKTDATNFRKSDYLIWQNRDKIVILEGGKMRGSYGRIRLGDVLRIERKDGKILYSKNGKVVKRVKTNQNYALIIKEHLYEKGSTWGNRFHTNIKRRLKVKLVNVQNAECINDIKGAASIEITGGTSPYNITWSTGEYGVESITNLAAGKYNVSVNDAAGVSVKKKFKITSPIIWPIIHGVKGGDIGVDKVALSLESTIEDQWINLRSYNEIAAKENGFVKYKVKSTKGSRIIGLNKSQKEIGMKFIEYAFLLKESNLYIIESGRLVGAYGSYKLTDNLIIERKEGNIVYEINGKELRTTLCYQADKLVAAVSLFGLGTTMESVEASFCIPEISIDAQTISAKNDKDGAIALNIQGGVPPYIFEWKGFPGEIYSKDLDLPVDSILPDTIITDQPAYKNGLASGTYPVKVIDALKNSHKTEVNIEKIPNLSVEVAVVHSSCSYFDGTISTTVVNGATSNNFKYTWLYNGDIISHDPNLTGLGAGLYTLKLSYDNSSTNSTSIYTKTWRLGYDVEWTNGISVISNGNNLTGDFNASYINTGAVSTNILSKETDGWFEFVLPASIEYRNLIAGFDSKDNITDVLSIPYNTQYNVLSVGGNTYGLVIPKNIPFNSNFGYDATKDVKVRIEKKFGYISYYLDEVLIGHSTVPVLDDLIIIGAPATYGAEIRNAITSFSCPAQINTYTKQYANLRSKLNGSYHIVSDNVLRFKYNEEYARSGTADFLNYKLFQIGTIDQFYYPASVVQSGTAPELLVAFQNNWFDLNLSGLALSPGKYYILEVSNQKNEKQYLKFKMSN